MVLYFFLVFKQRHLFNTHANRYCLPDMINPSVLTQIELLIAQPCSGKTCLLCPKSQSHRSMDGNHYLTYGINNQNKWDMVVDKTKYTIDATAITKYVGLPVRNVDKLLMFLNSTIGKPMNLLGYLNHIYNINGIKRNDPNAINAAKFYGAEAMSIALEWQGYGRFLSFEPGQMTLKQLFADCFKIPGCYVLYHSPSNML